jgi:hypothetical protein
MKAWGVLLLLLLGMAAGLQSGNALLCDWSQIGQKDMAGTYADKAGTLIQLAKDKGPLPLESSLKIQSTLVQMGGVWCLLDKPVSKDSALRFMARSASPCRVLISLGDKQKNRVETSIRLKGAQWQEMVLPLSLFKPTEYPDKDAVPNTRFQPQWLAGIQVSPMTQGQNTLWVGPVHAVSGGGLARTGRALLPLRHAMVQDFEVLETSSYGPFADRDSATRIKLELVADPENAANQAAAITYRLGGPNSWCGYWVRVGEDWNGQDWRGMRVLRFRLRTSQVLRLQLGFNDANQNAYVATVSVPPSAAWQWVDLPFSSFQLNPYYQPPEAKRGAVLNLSRIETLNIAPLSRDVQGFMIDDMMTVR